MSPQSTTQLEGVPDPVRSALRDGDFSQAYEISFHVNPFYLRGDFNGDGMPDHAVLVRHRVSGKVGIAIVHGGSTRVFLIGAGKQGTAGGDDFAWLDYWFVRSKGPVSRGAGERRVPRLRGEALLVGRSESASGLVYWNGTAYAWYQQSD